MEIKNNWFDIVANLLTKIYNVSIFTTKRQYHGLYEKNKRKNEKNGRDYYKQGA